MTPAVTSFVVFACFLGASRLALRLRRVLPEHHLSSDTKDTVKLTMGLVATMTALVLGLLVAGAVFLILEMDHPFEGLIEISSKPMRNTLMHLG